MTLSIFDRLRLALKAIAIQVTVPVHLVMADQINTGQT
jgi:hypothetical protein